MAVGERIPQTLMQSNRKPTGSQGCGKAATPPLPPFPSAPRLAGVGFAGMRAAPLSMPGKGWFPG